MIKFNFLPKFSILIIGVFILFTIVGTLTHEFGHIVVAKYLGYNTYLNYGSMNYRSKDYVNDKDFKKIEKLFEGNDYEDYDNWPEELKVKIEELNTILREKYPQNKIHSLWITIGGPAETLLTSFIGLLILFVRRKKWKVKFKILDWLSVFMSLFILREVFNFITGLYSSIIYSKSNFHGDEFRISRYLGYNEWIIPTLTLISGILISCYVIFKIIPVKFRFTFILSGLVGGILGFALWFGFLGKAVFN